MCAAFLSVTDLMIPRLSGFLLPAFHQLVLKGPPPRGFSKPKMLVLAPTRELSVQIMEVAVRFGRLLAIRSLCCYGGSSKYPQIAALQRGVECVIATPGRLNDLIEMGKVDLSGIEFLVLDEADRMLGKLNSVGQLGLNLSLSHATYCKLFCSAARTNY